MKKHNKDIFSTGVFLPRVVDVDYLGEHKLFLRFQDGKEGKIDLSDWVKEGIFSKLQDRRQFVQFGLEHGTLVWSNQLDISPEYLYNHCG